MRHSFLEVITGLLVLAVAGWFLFSVVQNSNVRIGTSTYPLQVTFSDASGLLQGSEVRIAGVKVGTVVERRVDTKTYEAVLTLQVGKEISLPVDSSARIVTEGLLGDSYLSIVPGSEENFLQPGQQIAFSQGSVNLMDVLGRFIFGAAQSQKNTH